MDNFRKIFIYGVIGIVSAAILAGFFVAGSPTKQRMVRFDQTRVNNLQELQYNIIYYWQAKEKLPTTLADVVDPTRGVSVPIDPESKASYEYTATGPLAFSLCATFNTASTDNLNERAVPMPAPGIVETYPAKYPSPDSWAHGEGRVCFDRTIDPSFYPPIQTPVKP